MSGQPYKYASDPQKYRQEFMDVLGIRADIDAMNLEANKVYKQTGQLPAVSQMQDNRTTAEIYADVQKMKLGIIRDLEPIADAQFASQIVETLFNSPLNSNNKLVIFLAQRAPEIANNLKKIYSFKIKGDINDANVFVQFVEDMYNKSKASFSSVESYFNKTGSEIERGINRNDIDKIKEIINRMKVRINNLHINKLPPIVRRGYTDDIRVLLERIDAMVNVFPSSEEMLKYDSYGLQVTEKLPFDDAFANHVRELNILIKEELPRTDTLQTAILHLEKFVENTNPSEFNDAYKRVLGYLPDDKTLATVRQLREYLNSDLNKMVRRKEIEQIKDLEVPVTLKEKASDTLFTSMLGLNPPDRTPPIEGVEGTSVIQKRGRGRPKGSSVGKGSTSSRVQPINNNNNNTLSRVQIPVTRGIPVPNNAVIPEHLITQPTERYPLFRNANTGQINILRNDDDYFNIMSREAYIYDENNPPITDVRRVGRVRRNEVLPVARGRGRPKGSGIKKTFKEFFLENTDKTKGIQPEKRYISFGKYLINKNKLNDNIIAIKRPSGANINEFPSSKVSDKLGTVFRKIVGGNIPTFNELSDLSEEEKMYLHNVAKKAEIEDKFSIPAPSKDKQEKDIHNFEVMKGEIMSGNDSKELIKKFKLLLVKLSKNGTLPKREVQEIMQELLELGY